MSYALRAISQSGLKTLVKHFTLDVVCYGLWLKGND